MTAIRCVTLICDGCGTDAYETNHFQTRPARRQAIRHGWTVSGARAITADVLKDYCPACTQKFAQKRKRRTRK